MHRFALLVIFVTLLSGSMAQAASYEKTDGTIVDPIMDTGGSPHSYSGNNLEPNANLTYANLSMADLTDANLNGATLTSATLTGATFSTGTILYDGQSVQQHGFDAASRPRPQVPWVWLFCSAQESSTLTLFICDSEALEASCTTVFPNQKAGARG